MRQAHRCGLLLMLILALGGCRHSRDIASPKTQENFGVQMARSNLWREAMFRFRRAVELDPSNAVAHNNLAVAYEANGDFDSAAKEYREALRLDRSNQYIQKNYSRFVEFLSRNKKRQQKQSVAEKEAPAATATPGQTSSQPAAGAATPPVTTSTAPPPATSTAPPPPPPPSPNPPQGGAR